MIKADFQIYITLPCGWRKSVGGFSAPQPDRAPPIDLTNWEGLSEDSAVTVIKLYDYVECAQYMAEGGEGHNGGWCGLGSVFFKGRAGDFPQQPQWLPFKEAL